MGTARRTESQMSAIIPGTVKEIAIGRKRLDDRTEVLSEKRGLRLGDDDSESGKARGAIRHDAVGGSIRNAMVVKGGVSYK